jgi:hypothetical protein
VTIEDPLRELVVDSVEVDRQRIADALRGVVGIDKSGQVLPQQGFEGMTADGKVLAFLLARKAAVLLDLAEDEPIGPKDLAKQAGMPEGTVAPTVRGLLGRRLVSQDVDSAYYLSPHQVGTAVTAVSRQMDRDAEPTSRVKAKSASARTRTPRTTQKREATEGPAEIPDAQAGARKRRPAAGFSPTNAIRGLIDGGFFKQPKTLTDVQRQFKDKQGRDLPVTTLSPVFTRLLRDNALDRAKREDGTYEYFSNGGG